jgi:hypothetical protein
LIIRALREGGAASVCGVTLDCCTPKCYL